MLCLEVLVRMRVTHSGGMPRRRIPQYAHYGQRENVVGDVLAGEVSNMECVAYQRGDTLIEDLARACHHGE